MNSELRDARVWDAKVQTFMAARFKDAPRALNYYLSLWADHQAAELAAPHFVSELVSSSTEKFFQRVWEMTLGRHLRACGYDVASRPEGEPDYSFTIGDQRVWVEAISPSPGPDLPSYWTTLDPLDLGPSCGTVPNTEMLLRWTSAFKEKTEKGAAYREKGVVGPKDAFVIAIDGSQLCKFPHTHGISRSPFVVECVFAIGPLAMSIDRETRKLGQAYQTVEFSVENRNKSTVPKECFFREDFSGVSAVLGCYAESGRDLTDGDVLLPVQIAYNPLASNPLIPGLFGSKAEEWVAVLSSEDEEGKEWTVEKLTGADTSPAGV